MIYVEGFVTAVPAANKDAYIRHARAASGMIKEYGVTRMVECWGDDVPDGVVTDFKGAVQAGPDEVVVFSWFEYPDKAVRDAEGARMMADPRMKEIGASMPFDGKRMIYGGFAPLLNERADGGSGYVDGFLVPVPSGNREAYREVAVLACGVFLENGATRVVEAWSDDVPDGAVTDFKRAVKAEEGEAVVFSWIEWPSKEARVTGWEKVMADPRMQYDPAKNPFDGKRMIWGGFTPILDA